MVIQFLSFIVNFKKIYFSNEIKKYSAEVNNVSRFLIVPEKCVCAMNMFLFSEKDKASQRAIY